jgi:hypothetical protein
MEIRPRAALCESPFLHGRDQQIGDADPRRAGSEKQDALLDQRRIDDLEGRREPRQRDAGRPLNVVVVAEDPVGIPVEEPDRVGPLPVLEVDTAPREDLLDGLHELLDELVQLPLGGGLHAEPEVERVGAERVVGRADIEDHGQEAPGRHGGAGRVELQLSDRDPHSVRPDVAEAQDASPRGHADEADVALGPVAEHLGDAALHLPRDVEAARAAVDVSEREAGVGDGRVVEDRQKARRVGHHRAVEERLVPVRETDEIDVPLQIARLRLEVVHDPLDLPLEALHRVREEPFETVSPPLLRREGRTLVGPGVIEQRGADSGFALRASTSLDASTIARAVYGVHGPPLFGRPARNARTTTLRRRTVG